MKRVLILTDGKAGHENQSKAFARALGCEFDLVEVHFKSKLAKALSYLLDRLGIRTLAFHTAKAAAAGDSALPMGLCDLPALCGRRGYSGVIGTGSGTFYAAKALARKLGVRCGVVLYPRGYDIASFDCVLAPTFDRPKKAPNVIGLPANLVATDELFYRKGVEAFRLRTEIVPDVAVIIGGPNRCSTMSAQWMRERLDEIFAQRGVMAVTTSRRTPREVERVVDEYPWDYKLIYSRDRFNPIPAFVQLARKLYVTAESTGMLSEACTFGTAAVVALDNLKPGRHKFRRFVEDLRREGYVDGARKIDLTAQFAEARRLMGL